VSWIKPNRNVKKSVNQGCQIFIDTLYQQGGLLLNYQMDLICIFQMAIHWIYQPFPFQGPPKFTPIDFFGLKIYHLATLLQTRKIRSKISKLSRNKNVKIRLDNAGNFWWKKWFLLLWTCK
jgi:hypothetical protein